MRPGVDLRTAQFGSVSRTRRLPYTCGCFPSEHSLAAVDVGSPGVRVDAAGSTDPGGLDGARVHHPVDGHGRGPGLSGALSDGHQLAGGCHQPAAACEVHHLRHKGRGGVTSLENCILLCWYHHHIVIHQLGWTLVRHPDGTTTAWNRDKTKVLRSHSPPARAG